MAAPGRAGVGDWNLDVRAPDWSRTDNDVFLAFCKEDLLPRLKPGQTVVLDNLGAHRSAEVIELFQQRGIGLKFLPPYSPELNPIELLWHWLKDRIRAVRPRDTATLDAAIRKALLELPRENLEAWCRNCGYKRP
jgi:transposase